MKIQIFFIYLGICLVSIGCGSSSPHSSLQPPSAQGAATQGNSEAEGGRVESPYRRRGNELTRATDTYGPLVVQEGEYFTDTGVQPWAASWYPMFEDSLFRSVDSPLAKYDQYAKKVKQEETSAADFEKKHFYFPDGANWSGRCDAWAIASLMSPEPNLKKDFVVLDGIQFKMSDLKALTVLAYEQVDGLVSYGQRNNADIDSVPEDIYPEEFHKIIQAEMFQRKRPLIMDKDPGVEIWSTPVYKADLNIVRDNWNKNVMHVHATLVGANPLDSRADPNGRVLKSVLFNYTYDLFGAALPTGEFKVVYGSWTGNSERTHPDFVWSLPEASVHKSLNSEIDNSIVDEIVGRALQFSFEM